MKYGDVVGTPSYLSPEMFNVYKNRVDDKINYEKSDCFSLGLTFIYFLVENKY